MAKSKYASKPRYAYDTKSPSFHQGAWKHWKGFSQHGMISQAFSETASAKRPSRYQTFVEPYRNNPLRQMETVWAR